MDQFSKWLVSITLIEMMVAIGMGVTWNGLVLVAKNRRLILASVFANYFCVPAAGLVLVHLLNSAPLTSAGFLIIAVCPGSSYGPPMTQAAKGNLAVAVGLMVLLSASSAVVAPVWLHVLLPLASTNDAVSIDLAKVIGVLLVTQLVPVCIGLSIRHWWPNVAQKLKRPADRVALALNIVLITCILATHYSLFSRLEPRGIIGMTALLVVSLSAGWLLGGPATEDRRALALTSSLRNVGPSLVIATAAFPGTPAVVAVLGYALFEIVGSLMIVTWWHRSPAAEPFEQMLKSS